ncbi:hypothetical protein [Aquimarina sp. AU474]|uniref:hypothetical protein n=1 Tax=Aquimarina sp. AU474 TaxID=2108529 RepID=UPI000D68C774|nr:hypothetical protein [Aquimarina sp. AU474]
MYYALQILGSFIEFGIFGSGSGIKGYELHVPIGMVILQIILTTVLKYRMRLFRSNIIYALMMIIPVGLFMYYYFLIVN